MKRLIAAVVLAGLGTSLAFAGPLEDRKAMMKAMAANTKTLAGYAKGETPFDAAKVKELLQVYVDDAAKMPGLFPAGSDTGDTTAAPKIWEDTAGFTAAAGKLAADATAAQTATDQASFQTAFATVTANCTSCHGAFRIKK